MTTVIAMIMEHSLCYICGTRHRLGYCPASGTDDPMEPCHGEESKAEGQASAQGESQDQAQSESSFENEISGSEKACGDEEKEVSPVAAAPVRRGPGRPRKTRLPPLNELLND